MIEYILQKVGPKSEIYLNTIVYYLIEEARAQKHITFNDETDKFEILISEVSPQIVRILEKNGCNEKGDTIIIANTDLHIKIWKDKINFWLE